MPVVKTPVFQEFFAGSGRVNQAVTRIGITTLPPQDVETGGIDFLNQVELDQLWQSWRDEAAMGKRIYFHAAPPCSTFSRARDRSSTTRLRSSLFPAGLYPGETKTEQRNESARRAIACVRLLVEESEVARSLDPVLGCLVTPWCLLKRLQTAFSVGSSFKLGSIFS